MANHILKRAGWMRTGAKYLGLGGLGAYGAANLGHQLGAYSLREGSSAPSPTAPPEARAKYFGDRFTQQYTNHLGQIAAAAGDPKKQDEFQNLLGQESSGAYGAEPGTGWRNWGITKAIAPWVGGQDRSLTAGENQAQYNQAGQQMHADYSAAMKADIAKYDRMKQMLEGASSNKMALPPAVRSQREATLKTLMAGQQDPRVHPGQGARDILQRGPQTYGFAPEEAIPAAPARADTGTGSGWGYPGITGGVGTAASRPGNRMGSRPMAPQYPAQPPQGNMMLNPAYQYLLEQNIRGAR